MKTVPAIYVAQKPCHKGVHEDIVYGICKFDRQNTMLHFISLPSQPMLTMSVALKEITEINLHTIEIAQIHLLRRASAPLYQNESVDGEEYSMTCSCNSRSGPEEEEAQIRKYLKYILMEFDSDVISVLRELSGEDDNNAVQILTESGCEHILISSVRNTHIIEHFIDENSRIVRSTPRKARNQTFFRKPKREKNRNRSLDYEMSSNEVVFPIKEFADVDCITLSKSTEREVKKQESYWNCVEAATERLVKQIYNLDETMAHNVAEYFEETPTTILTLEELSHMLELFPDSLLLDFESIIIVFSVEKDGRWLQTMLVQIPIQHIETTGVIALLSNNPTGQREIEFYQSVNRFCLLLFKTQHETFALLFSSFPKDVGSYAVKEMHYYICEEDNINLRAAYKNIVLTRRSNEFTIQIEGAVFARVENDMKRVYSSMHEDGKPVIAGDSQGSLSSTELISLEAWRFLYE